MRLARKKPLNEIEDMNELENEIVGPGRLKNFSSHMRITKLKDGRCAVSF